MIPFTQAQFLDTFARYNNAVFPAQWPLYGVALAAVALAAGNSRRRSQLASLLLASLWLWSGAVYHWLFFSETNGAGYLFGALFVAQAAMLVADGVIGSSLAFRPRASPRELCGALLLLYALALYPLLGYAAGHRYPAAPTFGAPCPVTIYTFGLLLWSRRRVPARLLVVPALWAATALGAALELGMYEDFALPFAATLCIAWQSRDEDLAAA